MPLAEDKIDNSYSITAYDADHVRINDQPYQGSLILSPQKIHAPWPITSVSELNSFLLAPLFELKPEVVLLGTGDRQVFPSAEIFAIFAQYQLGLEVMANSALYRTYNILAAEDRQVVAAIIQPS